MGRVDHIINQSGAVNHSVDQLLNESMNELSDISWWTDTMHKWTRNEHRQQKVVGGDDTNVAERTMFVIDVDDGGRREERVGKEGLGKGGRAGAGRNGGEEGLT